MRGGDAAFPGGPEASVRARAWAGEWTEVAAEAGLPSAGSGPTFPSDRPIVTQVRTRIAVPALGVRPYGSQRWPRRTF